MIILIYTNIIELNWNYPTLRIIPLQEAIGCQIKSLMAVVIHFPSGDESVFPPPNTKVIWTIVFVLSDP